MTALPPTLAGSVWRERVELAIAAVRAAGAALVELRGTIHGTEAQGGQLKTSTDLAAEGWVLGFLRGTYPDELFLAEEEFEQAKQPWRGARTYWTVDALDGTRSYVEGFPGFCSQVAYVEDGEPVVGVIAEPVAACVYVAARGAGAWRLTRDGAVRLGGSSMKTLTTGARFVDSTPPGGALGAMLSRVSGRFVECGSVGLKICRVVEDMADIYAKAFTYKLWDVAPGDVLVLEIGGVLGTWNGEPIDYAGTRTHYKSVLAAPRPLYEELLASGELSEYL